MPRTDCTLLLHHPSPISPIRTSLSSAHLRAPGEERNPQGTLRVGIVSTMIGLNAFLNSFTAASGRSRRLPPSEPANPSVDLVKRAASAARGPTRLS